MHPSILHPPPPPTNPQQSPRATAQSPAASRLPRPRPRPRPRPPGRWRRQRRRGWPSRARTRAPICWCIYREMRYVLRLLLGGNVQSVHTPKKMKTHQSTRVLVLARQSHNTKQIQCTATHQVVVVGVEPLAQLQPALLRWVRAAAGHGEVAREGAAGEVVEAVFCVGVGELGDWYYIYTHMYVYVICTHRLGTQPRYSTQLRTQSACVRACGKGGWQSRLGGYGYLYPCVHQSNQMFPSCKVTRKNIHKQRTDRRAQSRPRRRSPRPPASARPTPPPRGRGPCRGWVIGRVKSIDGGFGNI